MQGTRRDTPGRITNTYLDKYQGQIANSIQYIKSTNVTYPFAIDSDGSFFESFTIAGAGVTRNIVLDKEGKISFLTRLFDENEFQQMINKIEFLLK